MTEVLAIDPGPTQSAWLVFQEPDVILRFGKSANEDLLVSIGFFGRTTNGRAHLALEAVESFGMAVGREVFDTVFWSGRFAQAWQSSGRRFSLVSRRSVKLHLCNSVRAKDGNVRQALLDRFGAPGTKKEPGKTYGISKDVWSALAIAVTYCDLERLAPRVAEGGR